MPISVARHNFLMRSLDKVRSSWGELVPGITESAVYWHCSLISIYINHKYFHSLCPFGKIHFYLFSRPVFHQFSNYVSSKSLITEPDIYPLFMDPHGYLSFHVKIMIQCLAQNSTHWIRIGSRISLHHCPSGRHLSGTVVHSSLLLDGDRILW